MLGGLAGVWLMQRSPNRRVSAWVLAVVGPAFVTLALIPFRSSLVIGGMLLCMLLVSMAVVATGGVRPALTAVVVGTVATGLYEKKFLLADPGPDVVRLVLFVVIGAAAVILFGEIAQLAEEQASSRRVEAALRRVATLVARGAPADELFAVVTQEAGQLLQAGQITMCRYEPDATATVVAGWSRTGGAVPVGIRDRLGEKNLTTIISQTRRPARIDSYADASGAAGAVARAAGFCSAVGTPIIVQGRLWGAMIAGTTLKQPLPPGTEARLASFTELVSTAISNAENLAQLTASRARVVAAADETRRQIERDLHDGAQQRLVSLGLALRLAQMRVPPGLGELEDQLARVAEGLASVRDDVREMARGVHPAILADGGLTPALKTLARRSTIPVTLDVRTQGRLPEPVEVAAYYVVSEALTNAAKHANATVIHVGAQTAGRVFHLSVCDDGVGGADPAKGSGIVGLKDRVEALGGTITVHSPMGHGTDLRAELPLAN